MAEERQMSTKKHVLVLQFDPDARRTIVDILTSEGYLVTAAASVPEALEDLKGQRFDLVVSGLRMGEAHGVQVVG